MSPETMAELYQSGWTTEEIAAKVGAAPKTIRKRLDSLGIERRPRGRRTTAEIQAKTGGERRPFVLARATSEEKARRAAKAAAKLKACSTCRKPQPRSQFNRHPNTADGLNTECRSCRTQAKAQVRAREAAHARQILEIEIEWRLADLNPSPDEYAVWLKAVRRYGLYKHPTPDAVLAKYYGSEDWMPKRRGLASLVCLMAEGGHDWSADVA